MVSYDQRGYGESSPREGSGESLAGLFVVETLLLEPDLFDTYIALDPSLWWNDHKMLDGAAERAQGKEQRQDERRRAEEAIDGEGARFMIGPWSSGVALAVNQITKDKGKAWQDWMVRDQAIPVEQVQALRKMFPDHPALPAVEMVRSRSGSHFDPEIVGVDIPETHDAGGDVIPAHTVTKDDGPRAGSLWPHVESRVLDLAGFRAQRDLAHMRDVEQAGRAPGLGMLGQNAGRVLHRHVVAREGNHLAAARHMERVQGGTFELRFVARQHSGTLKGSGDQPPKNPKESPICRCA